MLVHDVVIALLYNMIDSTTVYTTQLYNNSIVMMLFISSGALPPDLTFVVLARERNEDYVFSYLMGYQDPPAGIEVPDGQYYNVYFPGQGTSMAPPLFNDMITYEDGMLALVYYSFTLPFSSERYSCFCQSDG